MGHVVAAPLVILKTQEGGVLYLYDGMAVPANADAKDVKRLAGEGFFADSQDAASEEEPVGVAFNSEPAGRPAGNASREEWAAYAVASGQATEEEVAGLTRDELRGLYS